MLNIAIGYDRTNRLPAYTLTDSILEHTSKPVSFTYLHRKTIPQLRRPIGPHDSTEFSISRFMVPSLFDYAGWTLFLDNDMIVQDDISELFDLADPQYAVMCVKHNQVCKSSKKFLGKEQVQYRYKNWSSVMLFNNSKCTALSQHYVNTAPGLDLHQFKWLAGDHLIGDLPLEWNYLVGNENQTTERPKLIHYTEGGPFFEEYKRCEYNEQWFDTYERINDVRSI